MTGTTAPPVHPAVAWRFPTGEETLLGNGIRVLAYHCPGQYIVHATLLFGVPLTAEPRDVEGVAALVARCLSRGAGGMSADEFSDALAASGAELEAAASPDGFALHLSVPHSHLARGLDLMAMAVTEPTYAQKEFEQEKRLRLQEIDHSMAYPGAVTVEHLNAALFGTARAARPVGGTTETVQAVTREDVVAFSAAHLQPTNAVLVLAGDVAGVDPDGLAARAFAAWRHDGGPVVSPADSPVSRQPRLIVVDWPASPQATLRMAGPGITRGDPRWPSMFVGNYVVGGSFGSRLNTVLREQKGLTYGVGSTLDTGRGVGVLTVGASVQSERAGEAVGDILAILGDARGTLRDDEVSTAVRAASDSAALNFERAEAVAARVEMLVTQGLPLDHVDANLEQIRRVTTASANATYAEVVAPEMFTVVVAGAASELVGPLEAIGHAPVEVLPRPAAAPQG